MLNYKARIPKKQRAGTLQPVMPLVPDKLSIPGEDKGSFVTYECKNRVGAAEGSTKYKKSMRKFEEGMPQQ